MSTRPWTRSAALFLVLPMLVVVIAYDLAWWFSDSSGESDGYLESIVAQAQPALSLGAVFVAAAGAASGLAFRRTGLAEHPGARYPVRIVLQHLAPTLGLGLVCWTACVLVSVAYASTVRLSWEPIPLIAVQLLGLAAWAVLGFALGASRLGASSLAIVPVLCFFVFGFFESLPVRFGSALSGGDFSYCCGPAETVAPGALLSTGLFAIALMLASVALLASGRERGSRMRGVAAVASVIVACSAAMAGSTTPYPAIAPRAGTPPCQVTAETSVCLWTEQAAPVPTAPSVIADQAAMLQENGVEIPDVISADLSDPEALHYPRTPTTPDGARTLLITALTSTGESCGPFDEHASDELMVSYSVVSAWLYRAGGLDSVPITDSMSADEADLWTRLGSLPHSQQVDWVNSALGALHTCAPSAPALPGGGR